jgi:uncharacterized repeat protein (TIGR03803 family)
VQGTDGNFYGTTEKGYDTAQWSTGYGTVFKVTPDGVLTVLYYFGDYPETFGPGALPVAALIQGNDGFLYGTSEGYPTDLGLLDGSIFQISTNGSFSALAVVFNSVPINQLVRATDGSFYGKTYSGGVYGWGTVYRLTVNGTNGTLTTIVSLNGTNGAETFPATYQEPDNGPMVLGADGNLYGTTLGGGPSFNPNSYVYGDGTIFQLNTNGTLTTLYSFSGGSDGGYPVGGLTKGTDGNFYGVTDEGGLNPVGYNNSDGTIFRLSVPMQPVFQTTTVTNGGIILCWTAVAGQTYQMQYNTDLTTINWNNLGGTITETNGIMVTCDSMGLDAQRFYRVVLLP